MKKPSVIQIANQDEKDEFQSLVYAKFEATFAELEFFGRSVRNVPQSEVGDLLLWWLFGFATDMAIAAGQTQQEFVEAMTTAYKTSVEESEEESEEEEGNGEEEAHAQADRTSGS